MHTRTSCRCPSTTRTSSTCTVTVTRRSPSSTSPAPLVSGPDRPQFIRSWSSSRALLSFPASSSLSIFPTSGPYTSVRACHCARPQRSAQASAYPHPQSHTHEHAYARTRATLPPADPNFLLPTPPSPAPPHSCAPTGTRAPAPPYFCARVTVISAPHPCPTLPTSLRVPL